MPDKSAPALPPITGTVAAGDRAQVVTAAWWNTEAGGMRDAFADIPIFSMDDAQLLVGGTGGANNDWGTIRPNFNLEATAHWFVRSVSNGRLVWRRGREIRPPSGGWRAAQFNLASRLPTPAGTADAGKRLVANSAGTGFTLSA